jgi:hypothetical protein
MERLMKSDRLDKTAVQIFKTDEAPTDFAYWQTRSFEERLAALESIRNDYIKWAYDIQPGFQRVYRIIKQA